MVEKRLVALTCPGREFKTHNVIILTATEWLRVCAVKFFLTACKRVQSDRYVCQLWSHSDRHLFVSDVEVNNTFHLDLSIFIFIVALHEIVHHSFEKMRRVINDKQFLVTLKYIGFFY